MLNIAKESGYIEEDGNTLALTERGLTFAGEAWHQLSETERLCIGMMLLAQFKVLFEHGEMAGISWPN